MFYNHVHLRTVLSTKLWKKIIIVKCFNDHCGSSIIIRKWEGYLIIRCFICAIWVFALLVLTSIKLLVLQSNHWYIFVSYAKNSLYVYIYAFIRVRPWALQWRHNGCNGVSNHQPHDCLLNRLFRHRSRKTSKLRVTGLCGQNSPVIGEFPAKRIGNAKNISIWWRHHGIPKHSSHEDTYIHICLKLLIDDIAYAFKTNRIDMVNDISQKHVWTYSFVVLGLLGKPPRMPLDQNRISRDRTTSKKYGIHARVDNKVLVCLRKVLT